MKRSHKAGLAVFILVIPAFIIFFLHLFGENKFYLQTYYPKIDSTTGKVITLGADTVYHTIPKFELINTKGQKFNSENFEGKIYVADFFFSRCGTICPKLTHTLSRIQELFAQDSTIQIVSFTVDPHFDTPEVLKKHASKNLASEDKWHFLTGDKALIYQLAIKGFFLPVSDASAYNKTLNSDDAFIHSERIVLVDAKGQIRGYYDGTDAKEIDRLIAEIRLLKKISN